MKNIDETLFFGIPIFHYINRELTIGKEVTKFLNSSCLFAVGILSKDTMQTLTSKKQPRQTIAQTRTTEKVTKPLTIAEMRADILGK